MESGAGSQIELFDSPLRGNVTSERRFSEFPFFALSKKRRKPMSYQFGDITIIVKAGDSGIATVYDRDLILYIGSIISAKLENGEPVDQTITFTAHDFIRVCGKNRSMRTYERLVEAIERLQGTQIKTNIETGGEGQEGFFSWVENARISYARNASGKKVMKSVTIRLCDWLYRAIIRDRGMLTYNAAYFNLKGSIERRLYDIAIAKCGTGSWREEIGSLKTRVGAEGELYRFRANIEEVVEKQPIPDYTIRMTREFMGREAVTFVWFTYTGKRSVKGHQLTIDAVSRKELAPAEG